MKINTHFFIFILIALIALLSDYIIYVFGTTYIVGLSMSFLLCFIIGFILLKFKKIKLELNWNKYDIFFLIVIFIYVLSRIFVSDFSYDVANYHIYLQQCFPIDKINFDFFAGKTLNAFLFPLGDRMFYIFRYFLGYRLGTILSYYSLVVIYYEVKRILQLSINSKKLVPVFSMICVFSSYIVNQWTGTYYIDNFSIPLILELIYMILNYKKYNNFKNTKIVLFGLITGIATAIKITNLILIFPIIIWAIFELKPNKKSIIPIIFAIISFIVPIFIYAFDNFIQTGSILFPYYNNILHSKYFGNFSWVDSRFGINSFWKAIIWPIYVSIIHMGYGDDWLIKDYIWAIGFVITITYLIYSLIKKNQDKTISKINIISLVLTVIWILFLQGYMRYALIIPVLYSIVISYILIKIIKKVSFKKGVQKSLYFIFILTYFIIVISQTIFIYNSGYENKILIDRNIPTIHINGVWGTIADSSAQTVLVRENNTPIYNLDKSTIDTSNLTLKMFYDRVKNSDIYILLDDNSFEYKLNCLASNGFELYTLIAEYDSSKLPFLETGDKAYVYKLKYVGGLNEEK